MNKRKVHILFFCFHFFSVAVAQEETGDSFDSLALVVEPPYSSMQRGVNPFDSIIIPGPVTIRRVSKSMVDSLKASDDFWYANAERPKKKKQEAKEQPGGKTIFEQRWFRSLLWVVILSSFIGVVFWYLVSSNIFVFSKVARKIDSSDGTSEAEENIFSIPYEKEIDAAIASGNYRLAIRLWYLRTLKELSGKELIDYRYGRTNQDYVAQLASSSYYRDFFRLTRHFEYTWYGQFDLSADAYNLLQHDFVKFHNNLGR